MVKKQTVADYLTAQMAAVGKTNREIAEAAGYPAHNVSFISMLRSGKAKLPVNKVVAFARALEIEPAFLLRKVLEEYSPDTAKVIAEVLESRAGNTTQGERELLEVFRQESAGLPLALNNDEKAQVRAIFKVACKRTKNDPATKRTYDRHARGWVMPGNGNKTALAG
jgi:transcriptional regulator with XRE-family HTH domain